jgi:hypothetical protein
MATAALMAVEFAFAAVIGFLVGGLAVAVMPSGGRGGPTTRMVRALWLLLTVAVCGEFWAGAFGLVPNISYGNYPAAGYGLAVGVTAGASLVVRRRVRVWRQASGDLRMRPGFARQVIRIVDYAAGVTVCNSLLGGAIYFKMKTTRADFSHWLGGHVDPRVATLAARVGLLLAGFLYAQLISGGAIRALNAALRDDWAVTRKWNYLLLVPPFALVAPLAIVAPGLLAGIALHMANLFVGWRYTNEPPGTTIQTIRRLRMRSAAASDPAKPAKAATRANAADAAAKAKAAEAEAGRQPRPRTLEELRDVFLSLHAAKARPHERTCELRRLLGEMLIAAGLPPDQPLTLHGEQVEGAIRHNGIRYALAARWPAEAERTGLGAFGRIPPAARQDQVRLLLNINGFTPGVHHAYTASAPIIAIDGGHLLAVLEERIALGLLLDRLKRHADQTGHPYLAISQALAP